MSFKCRVCDNECLEFLDLRKQPAANGFLSEDEFKKEKTYSLTVNWCDECGTIQLGDVPDLKNTFNDKYPFYTGTSSRMVEHFKGIADRIKANYLPEDGAIIEIGSNDGTFLSNFKDYNHVGIDPSSSVNAKALADGLNISTSTFQDFDLESDEVNVVFSANTFAHIPDRLATLSKIKKVLSQDGVWINEEPYFGNVIDNLSFDQFYNEHIFYTSISSMAKVLSMFDMYIDSFEFIWPHGGSIRYFIRHGKDDIGSSMAFVIGNLSQTFELNPKECLLRFGDNVYDCIRDIKQMVLDIGKPIIGYGAPAKSTTILNACDIGPDLISKIYDTTPEKQGKYSPGKHIPIVSYDEFRKDKTKDVMLFIWNHLEEVMNKESGGIPRKWWIPNGHLVLPVAESIKPINININVSGNVIDEDTFLTSISEPLKKAIKEHDADI